MPAAIQFRSNFAKVRDAYDLVFTGPRRFRMGRRLPICLLGRRECREHYDQGEDRKQPKGMTHGL